LAWRQNQKPSLLVSNAFSHQAGFALAAQPPLEMAMRTARRINQPALARLAVEVVTVIYPMAAAAANDLALTPNMERQALFFSE
jgi:hypothetical protein